MNTLFTKEALSTGELKAFCRPIGGDSQQHKIKTQYDNTRN
jgi:hypothetical protein